MPWMESEGAMTPDEAVAIAGMRSVDLWKLCRRNDKGDYAETPDSVRERALYVLAQAWEEREGQTCETCCEAQLHTSHDYRHSWMTCGLTDHNCNVFNNRCGAWEKRDE